MLLVAKSYADWESIGTAYEKNKKQYIQVINPKTGAAKEVRVYTEAEYKRMYPDVKIDKQVWNQRKILGFKRNSRISDTNS